MLSEGQASTGRSPTPTISGVLNAGSQKTGSALLARKSLERLSSLVVCLQSHWVLSFGLAASCHAALLHAGGLSAGAIVGIVLAVLAFVFIVGGVAALLLSKRREERKAMEFQRFGECLSSSPRATNIVDLLVL